MATFKEWLKYKIDNMVVVQRTFIGTDADLIVLCWSGVQVNIHLIRDEIKPRAIKKILQTATQSGVNSLFLVNSVLLPKDGELTLRRTWMLAIHALIGERIYAYSVQKGVPEIRQVHFEPINGTQDYKAWYGPKVNFSTMRFYRQSVIAPSVVKGDWLVADFADYNFWKDQNFQVFRTKTSEHKHPNKTTWQTWSQTSWGESLSPYQSPIQEYLERCYILLGVDSDAAYEDVKTAYRKLVLVTHPDTSELPDDEANKQFHELQEAYDYIKSANGWE